MEDTVADLLDVNFIQDSNYLSVGHPDGIAIHTTAEFLTRGSKVQQNSSDFINIPDAIIATRLINTHLIIMVLKNEPRVMHVYHASTKETIFQTKFTNPILSIKLNRSRLIVCMEDSIRIYGTADVQLKHTIRETPRNELGLFDLVATGNESLIAYPGSGTMGKVHIYDVTRISAVTTFIAHEGPLAALKFNVNGTMIATASDKGSVIRVFCTTDGQKMFEFRRGVTRYVNIYSLAFSEDSKYLCSSSNTESVHVFKLEKAVEPEPAPVANDWYSYLTQVATVYLPAQVNDLMTSGRSFAIARLPGNEKKSVATMITIKGRPYLLVATADGFLYRYSIDGDGGECNLIKQQKIGPGIDGTTDDVMNRTESNEQQVPEADDSDDEPPTHHVY